VDLYFDSGDDATAYPVILDSGSSNLAMAIESCTNCGEASTDLAPTLTSPEMCIEVTYGSGAWFGYEVESSYVAVDSDVSAYTTYAGITYQDDFFEGGDSYVGILGMAYQGIANSYYSDTCDESSSSSRGRGASSERGRGGGRSDAEERGRSPRRLNEATSSISSTTDAAVPFLYALEEAGAISEAAFAVAMCGDEAKVSIGGLDASMYTGDVSYAATQETMGEYYGYFLIYTTAVTVGTTSVTVEDVNEYGGLVVDTGTTLHYLPTATVKAIETAVTAAVDDATITSKSFYEWESCVSADDLSLFPDVTYTFSESSDDDASTFDVTLSPYHYMLDYDDCYYWGFEESTLGIFGNIGMKDRVVIFDVTNNQIGMATGVCTDDDTATFYKSPAQMMGEVVAQARSKSYSQLAVGLVSAVAVVGTVLASAFVVLNKVTTKAAASPSLDSEETKTLLPPM